MSTEAHKHLVRKVMEVLNTAIEEERVDCERPPSVAIDIVAAVIGGGDFLAYGGEVHFVRRVFKDSGATGYAGDTALLVHIPEEVSELHCKWCEKTYFEAEKSAPHHLCRGCYAYGPPTAK